MYRRSSVNLSQAILEVQVRASYNRKLSFDQRWQVLLFTSSGWRWRMIRHSRGSTENDDYRQSDRHHRIKREVRRVLRLNVWSNRDNSSKKAFYCLWHSSRSRYSALSTLVRFDKVYVVYFKTNICRVATSRAILKYCREIYQLREIAETVSMDQINTHYYASHRGPDFLSLLEQPLCIWRKRKVDRWLLIFGRMID